MYNICTVVAGIDGVSVSFDGLWKAGKVPREPSLVKLFIGRILRVSIETRAEVACRLPLQSNKLRIMQWVALKILFSLFRISF